MEKFYDKLGAALLGLIAIWVAVIVAVRFWWQIGLTVLVGLGAYIGARVLWRRVWRRINDEGDGDNGGGVHIHIHHD